MGTDDLIQILSQDVLKAAPALLGWRLKRGELEARIVEVEAYRGADDPAAHSYGKSKMKNMAMYGPPGNAYVYFSYGCHWMLNVVAHGIGDASAILIRAAEPISGIETMRDRRPKAKREADLLSGPGKLATVFQVGPHDNGLGLFYGSQTGAHLELLPPDQPVGKVLAGTRIGIARGKAHDRLWRFADGDRLQWVSRPLTFHLG